MKLLLKSALLLLLTGVLLGGGDSLWASKVSPLKIYGIELEPQGRLAKDQPVEMFLSFYPDTLITKERPCDQITVTIKGDNGVQYLGEESFSVNFDDYDREHPYSTLLSLNLPSNDTGCVTVILACARFVIQTERFFVTTGDTVEYHRGNPRDLLLIPVIDTVQHQNPRIGYVIPGEFPDQDSLYGIPPNPLDSNYEKGTTGHLTKEEALFRMMRKMELSPLTEEESQEFYIGNEAFYRRRGETTFHKMEPITDLKEYVRNFQDSIRANPPDNDYDVILDLRDTADYNLAARHIDIMTPTDSAGYYRAVIKRPVLIELINNGIEYRRTNRMPVPKRDGTKAPDKSGESFLPPPVILPINS